MESGTFDGGLRSEIPKLSRAQLEEVGAILLERDTRLQRNFTVVKDCLPDTRFEMNERTLASEVVGGVRRTVTIPIGTILKVESGPSAGERTINVLWGSRRIAILAEYLLTRGTEIREETASARH